MSYTTRIAALVSALKKQTSWTVLVIGELGDILSFPVTKHLIVTLAICVVAALTFVVLSMVHYFGIRAENHMLKDDLAKSKTALIVANREREAALIKLSVLEAGGKPDKKMDQPLPEPKLAAEASHAEKPAAVDKKDAKDVVGVEPKPIAELPPEKPAQPSKPTIPVASARVSVKELEIFKGADDPSVKFQFMVKNTDPEGKRVKGYTFVVLRPEAGLAEPVAVSPPAPLQDGKPTAFEKGQYFSILRYKYVRGTFPQMHTFDLFNTATVYVYSETGELLLEEVHDIDKIGRS